LMRLFLQIRVGAEKIQLSLQSIMGKTDLI
jgi:hypothetical protein